jgi:RNA polymerase sigma-70 factor (ECF subfamily)
MDERAVDLELVRRVQGGDRVAFDLLVQKYQHRIAHLVARYVRDPAEVEDVAQEAFIKAYRGLASFRGESAFYTWLYRIAINTAKNYLVSAGRRVPDHGVDAADAEQLESGTLLQEIDTPEHEALSGEIERAVFHAIDALPGELREAITLRELEGLSYEEIAEVMNCPIGTVRSRIFRARAAIDEQIRPLMDDTGATHANA